MLPDTKAYRCDGKWTVELIVVFSVANGFTAPIDEFLRLVTVSHDSQCAMQILLLANIKRRPTPPPFTKRVFPNPACRASARCSSITASLPRTRPLIVRMKREAAVPPRLIGTTDAERWATLDRVPAHISIEYRLPGASAGISGGSGGRRDAWRGDKNKRWRRRVP